MSYRTIFAVVNADTASTVSARYAIALAAACSCRLVLYSAEEASPGQANLGRTARHLEHLFHEASALALPLTSITESGPIDQCLPRRAQTEQADLVFYPLTPDEQRAGLFGRKPVHRLLQTLAADLAIMRIIHMGKPHPRRILVPLARHVANPRSRIRFITALSRSFHATITLFHLATVRSTAIPPDDLIRFRTELHADHVIAQERYAIGPIGRGIMIEAATRHNDLIVVGASERGLLRQLFYGNPAGDVMHYPPCNTILFRAGRPSL